jgi:hypothetical protein
MFPWFLGKPVRHAKCLFSIEQCKFDRELAKSNADAADR